MITLAEIFAKLNQTSTDSTASTGNTTGQSSSLQGTIGDLSVDFQQSLMALLSSDTKGEEETSALKDNDENEKNDLTARLGTPAGLDLEYDLSSKSLSDKLKNLHFMKMFDFDKDGELTKNNFNV